MKVEQKAHQEQIMVDKNMDTCTQEATPDEFDPEFTPELDYGDQYDICAENDDSMSDEGKMFQRQQRSDNDDRFFEEEQEAYSFEEEQESYEGDEGDEGHRKEGNREKTA
ncbi:uncharacterized protein EV422DRAFT_572614 [Fimicolochytrium jonesii]|uniref:uncharacterized protein n=1 Tax=Fimicolochytrium jonesii TaxID=1396493 RepID=UPI0022FE4BA8|nr:uncharacterized protein EV422DRAFT_572614 [Fimicolochytrium jonesii]KAI8815629.1 hypothetical protein EV422DRAFT_572614 [Fimicolochytrium jonesii]